VRDVGVERPLRCSVWPEDAHVVAVPVLGDPA